uniref:DOMON domain-containing protein n=1 Tax=Branchiostoma floridae TaxID=7739 RepID=C3XV49_BRAFL|eukprot:XP_002611966.1 hypothetical protein BRAFLDRAFT_91851 [Branchiostoma floridae]
MPGSDIVIGWVKDGQAYLTDRYADEKALPPEDESQDWELLSGYENDTHTVLRFKRKLQTCDVRDRVINILYTKESLLPHPTVPAAAPVFTCSTSSGTVGPQLSAPLPFMAVMTSLTILFTL